MCTTAYHGSTMDAAAKIRATTRLLASTTTTPRHNAGSLTGPRQLRRCDAGDDCTSQDGERSRMDTAARVPHAPNVTQWCGRISVMTTVQQELTVIGQ